MAFSYGWIIVSLLCSFLVPYFFLEEKLLQISRHWSKNSKKLIYESFQSEKNRRGAISLIHAVWVTQCDWLFFTSTFLNWITAFAQRKKCQKSVLTKRPHPIIRSITKYPSMFCTNIKSRWESFSVRFPLQITEFRSFLVMNFRYLHIFRPKPLIRPKLAVLFVALTVFIL